jgi:hypothetical protein
VYAWGSKFPPLKRTTAQYTFWTMMGAADGLAAAAATGDLTKDEVVEELTNAIRFMMEWRISAS